MELEAATATATASAPVPAQIVFHMPTQGGGEGASLVYLNRSHICGQRFVKTLSKCSVAWGVARRSPSEAGKPIHGVAPRRQPLADASPPPPVDPPLAFRLGVWPVLRCWGRIWRVRVRGFGGFVEDFDQRRDCGQRSSSGGC